jgi:hypothetical protein
MKWFGVFSIATLCLLICMSLPAYSQDDRHDTPATQDDKRDQAQDNKDKDHDRDQDHDRAQEERRDDHAQAEQHAEQHEDHDQRGRIPEDRFRASFGREHTFRVGHPVIVAGQPRFQYGGYWFAIAQPWPGGWLYTDPVYIDYVGGGYYLFNPVHPGIQLSINVVF